VYLNGSIANLEPHAIKMNYGQYTSAGIPGELGMFHLYTFSVSRTPYQAIWLFRPGDLKIIMHLLGVQLSNDS
jgi:hypothetical protein